MAQPNLARTWIADFDWLPAQDFRAACFIHASSVCHVNSPRYEMFDALTLPQRGAIAVHEKYRGMDLWEFDIMGHELYILGRKRERRCRP
ncbi:hypothetical protein D9M68_756660 [compost metagenome]